MKVEKCPRCDWEPLMGNCYQMEFIFGKSFDRFTHYFLGCGCHSECGIFKWIAILRYNRWARREARRIAKEGATK